MRRTYDVRKLKMILCSALRNGEKSREMKKLLYVIELASKLSPESYDRVLARIQYQVRFMAAGVLWSGL